MVMALTFLHDPPYMQRRVNRIDVVGLVLLATGLMALQIVLERGEREGWFESTFILPTAQPALPAWLWGC